MYRDNSDPVKYMKHVPNAKDRNEVKFWMHQAEFGDGGGHVSGVTVSAGTSLTIYIVAASFEGFPSVA